MNSSIKLTDAQLLILSAASRREDRCLTAPKSLKRPAAEKLAVGAADPAPLGAGATAEIAATARNSAAPNVKSAPVSSTPRQGTKIARVIELLRRDQGATLEALIVATGWLPHTARAALTGLRHSGYDVRLERGQNGSASVYRIDASQASAP